MRKMVWTLLLLWAWTAGMAQVTRYATDLRWNNAVHAYLGVVNPDWRSNQVTLTGYNAAGTPVGTTVIDMAGNSRIENAGNSLFPGSDLAWVRIDAERIFAGYVRYERPRGGDFSMVPLNHKAGPEVFVPQITDLEKAQPEVVAGKALLNNAISVARANDEPFPLTTILVNTSAESGTATQQPIGVIGSQRGFAPTIFPTVIEGFGDAGQQTSISYEGTVRNGERAYWDRLTSSGIDLTAVQHIGDFFDQQGLASMNLNRTPYRRLAFSSLNANEDDRATLVLVNVYDTPLPFQLNLYNIYDQPIYEIHDRLDPLERRSYDLSNQEFPDTITIRDIKWGVLTPLEGGMIGYLVYGNKDNSTLAATEGQIFPADNRVVPHTPSTNGYTTEVSIINLSDEPRRLTIYGYDAQGTLYRPTERIVSRPYQRLEMTIQEIFGTDAVTWMRINSRDEELLVESRITREGGMAVMRGIPIDASGGSDVFFAEFEQFGEVNLLAQQWRPYIFSAPEQFHHLRRYQPNRSVFSVPAFGEFFTDYRFDNITGFYHLGYESVYRGFGIIREPDPDTVGFISPFFEVPDHGTYYLSYDMRFYNPDDTTETSQYGMVFREEGSDEWHWFGVNGRMIFDRWAPLGGWWHLVDYRNETMETTAWFPMEYQLPEQFKGKRIQVGAFYNFVSDDEDIREAPLFFIDNLRVSPQPRELGYFNSFYGSGSFISSDFQIIEPEEEE